MRFHRKSVLAASFVLVGLAAAVGCGGDDSASPLTGGPDASNDTGGKVDAGKPDATADTGGGKQDTGAPETGSAETGADANDAGTGQDGSPDNDANAEASASDTGSDQESVEASRAAKCVETDAGLDRPTLTDNKLAAPADATVVAHYFAAGDQVYTCTETSDAGAGTFTWVLKTPDATLFNNACMEVGAHYLGPTWWLAADGSSVKGLKVDSAASPNANSIPQLVLAAVSHDADDGGPGLLSNVTWIQRLNTNGGNPPASCESSAVGQELRVAYTATYYFYSGGTGDAGVVPDAATE